jgi:hypothetical protein
MKLNDALSYQISSHPEVYPKTRLYKDCNGQIDHILWNQIRNILCSVEMLRRISLSSQIYNHCKNFK